MRGARAPRAPRRCSGRWLDSLRRVRFEKWQALGNDYAIVEERELPFELTPERIRRFCAPHTGVGSDGILLMRETEERGFVAEIRIYNPDGSEAELSGNGVRQAVMYLRRSGWTEHDSFSVRTVAGEVRPRIEGELCTLDIGRARLRAPEDFPSGADDGTGTLSSGGPRVRLPVRAGRQPAVLDRARARAWRQLDLALHGPEIERHELFPRRTNVSFWRRSGDASIRVRIFERGVGETMSSGTGATGAAVAAVLRGVDSPVTVELDGGELVVDVGEDMHVDLTGWARPVYAGVLSDEFVKELMKPSSRLDRLRALPVRRARAQDRREEGGGRGCDQPRHRRSRYADAGARRRGAGAAPPPIRARTSTRRTVAVPSCARRSPASTRAASASSSIPTTRSSPRSARRSASST